MPKKKNQPQAEPGIAFLSNKIDAILAILLRQLNDEYLEKWNNKDRPNIIKMLIGLGFDNKDISKIANLAYSTVANLRSKVKRKKPNRGKRK